MSGAGNVPLWLAVIVAILLLLGAGVTLTGAIGLLRFKSFYARMHAPTLGTTGGAGAILIASIVFFSVMQARLVLHELVILAFVVVTTPVTLTLLARAALYRDRAEDAGNVPALETRPPDAPQLAESINDD
jgi:multicomponent K+:H+ antiporter subunit G